MTRAPAGITFAPLQPERSHELVRMWRDSFEHGVGIVDPNPIEGQLAYFLDEVVPQHTVRVAHVGERIVGFIAASSQTVCQLYVDPPFHARGIGTRLLAWAKQQSQGSLWLFTFERNQRACAFYERHGFTAVARGFEPVWQLADVRYEWARDGCQGGVA